VPAPVGVPAPTDAPAPAAAGPDLNLDSNAASTGEIDERAIDEQKRKVKAAQKTFETDKQALLSALQRPNLQFNECQYNMPEKEDDTDEYSYSEQVLFEHDRAVDALKLEVQQTMDVAMDKFKHDVSNKRTQFSQSRAAFITEEAILRNMEDVSDAQNNLKRAEADMVTKKARVHELYAPEADYDEAKIKDATAAFERAHEEVKRLQEKKKEANDKLKSNAMPPMAG